MRANRIVSIHKENEESACLAIASFTRLHSPHVLPVLKHAYAGVFRSIMGHNLHGMIRRTIVDNNNLQIDGRIDDVCSPYPIDKKFEAFNFHVINIDGNDFDQIRAAFEEAKQTKGQPTAIIAKTVKGKGVSFMENNAGWHGKAPNDEEYKIAMEDLEKAGEALCQK